MDVIPIESIEAITQEAQTMAVHKEIASARLMDFSEIEKVSRIQQINKIVEFNALMNREALINQESYFDLYV